MMPLRFNPWRNRSAMRKADKVARRKWARVAAEGVTMRAQLDRLDAVIATTEAAIAAAQGHCQTAQQAEALGQARAAVAGQRAQLRSDEAAALDKRRPAPGQNTMEAAS
jgi:hypothetical protein